MVKFLFTRMSDPREPSWRHDPGAGAPVWESGDTADGAGEPIHLIGVEFSRATRNLTAFEVADA